MQDGASHMQRVTRMQAVRPNKSTWRVERPQGGPKGERSESSREISNLDPGLRRGDNLFRASLSKRHSA
jgi:hypothetical protein